MTRKHRPMSMARRSLTPLKLATLPLLSSHRVIQQLRADNSKLKVRNQKLKMFTAAMTLSFLSTLVVMGCFLYLYFNTNVNLDTIQPIACDECRMQLSLKAKVLANLSLQIEAIQHLSQRDTDTHNISEVNLFGSKNWSGKPILNWD